MGSKVTEANEAEHTTGIVWKVRREERLRRCVVGVTVVMWCCHTHTGNEVSSCVGGVVKRLQSLSVSFAVALWMQCGFGDIVCGLLGNFRWPVNTWLRVGVLEAQDGAAVGMAWPFPSSYRTPMESVNES